MRLGELQRAAVELCYGDEPSTAQYAAFGDARIWAIYREAVRSRLRSELKVALPRSCALLGTDRLERVFARFLAERPPQTRFFHAVVDCFAQAAVPWLRADTELPAHAADLCAYEAACWTVGDLPDDPPHEVVEFEFERRPVLTPALRLLALHSEVHVDRGAEPPEAAEALLCVYRKRDERKSRYFALNAVTYALMQRFLGGEHTVAQCVQQVANERAIAVDQPFLDGLCTVLADFMDHGIVLGGR